MSWDRHGKKAPLSNQKVAVGHCDFVDVGTGVYNNGPCCSCSERECLVLCLRCSELHSAASQVEKGGKFLDFVGEHLVQTQYLKAVTTKLELNAVPSYAH